MFLPDQFNTDRILPWANTWGISVNDMREELASKLARLEVENKQLRAAAFESASGLQRATSDLITVRNKLQLRRWVPGGGPLARSMATYIEDAARSLQLYSTEKARADAARDASRGELIEIAEHSSQVSYG